MMARRMGIRSLYSSCHDLHALLTVGAAVVGSEESKAGAAVIKILLNDLRSVADVTRHEAYYSSVDMRDVRNSKQHR
jgi:hypothetical protein